MLKVLFIKHYILENLHFLMINNFYKIFHVLLYFLYVINLKLIIFLLEFIFFMTKLFIKEP